RAATRVARRQTAAHAVTGGARARRARSLASPERLQREDLVCLLLELVGAFGDLPLVFSHYVIGEALLERLLGHHVRRGVFPHVVPVLPKVCYRVTLHKVAELRQVVRVEVVTADVVDTVVGEVELGVVTRGRRLLIVWVLPDERIARVEP